MNILQKMPSIIREYLVEIAIVLLGLGAVNAIFIAKGFRQSTTVDPESAAFLGSFVGGYIGPIFALVGVVLLYATLKNQRHATALQDFETKYFELVKMHRDNVAEIGMKNDSGRRLFVLLMRELRCALEIIQEITNTSELRLTRWELLHIGYYCLFFGTGPNSSRMLRISLSSFAQDFVDALVEKLNSAETKERVKSERKFAYTPFEGHQSRLGHYYRHLYQMVRYVHEAPPDLKIDKRKYMKTIRAQLSTHEQAMLLVNSLTPMGQNWWARKLITEYSLVKNIPREFFNTETEFDMGELFSGKYFEWQEDSLPLPNIGPWKK